MRANKTEIIKSLQETRMVPVFFNGDESVAKKIFDTCYAAGVRVFEFTNRGKNAFEVFAALVVHKQNYKDAFLGIGTVMNAADTIRFMDAGADFIVSPVLKTEMGELCNARNTLWIPGCATLTEIVLAHDAGAGVVKIFPASVLGPSFVKAVKPVIPDILLMPTGGIEPDDVTAWLDAGVFCVGMGSQLLKKETLDNNRWEELQQNVEYVLNEIKNRKRNK